MTFMTYDEAIKIIKLKQYSKCNKAEKKQMDMAIDFVSNPANMPKSKQERIYYHFKQEFFKKIEPICKYLNKIFNYAKRKR